jgi:hypothetical protein
MRESDPDGVNWYDVVSGPDLEQGDVFQDVLFPVVLNADPQRPEVVLEQVTAVVVSQTCDLVNGKLEQVLFAAVVSYEQYAVEQDRAGNGFVASKRFRRAVLDGALAPLSILRPSLHTPPLPWSLVDFRRTYSLPFAGASALADRLGPRLRTRSPYREHLAQGFARFYMRVGLPIDASEFEAFVP